MPCPLGVTVRCNVAVRLVPAAVTASIVAVPEPVALVAADRRSAEVFPPEMEAGAKLAVTPLGSPELESFHAVVPPPPIVTVTST